jgi:hypothetical protein
MTIPTCRATFAGLLMTNLLLTPGARAAGAPLTAEERQRTVENLQGLQDFLDHFAARKNVLGPPNPHLDMDAVDGPANALSAAGRQAAQTARHAAELQRMLEQHGDGIAAGLDRFANSPSGPSFTRFGGFTQNETSTAWCGKNAVIAFNDSGSLMATLFGRASPSRSLSFNGYAYSHDGGETFTQAPPLVADPLPPDMPGHSYRNILGDPVVACSSSDRFYYASLETDKVNIATPPGGDPNTTYWRLYTGLAVSISTDGGQTFSKTVSAVRKTVDHFLDKEWLAVVPGPRGDVLHVTYTDFDGSGTSTGCGLAWRAAIEHVRSIDGGLTWSEPDVIDEACGDDPFVQASQVRAVGHDVYVAWETYRSYVPGPYTFDEGIRAIKIRHSIDDGATFAPAVVVADVTPSGDGWQLQGSLRAMLEFQGLAVDPRSGAVYVVWQDGRNASVADPLTGNRGVYPPVPRLDRYNFADVLLSRSGDWGATWSAPVRVNDDAIDLQVDQFMPTVAVDHDGKVYVSFYDRRRDPRNYLIDNYLATSADGGRHFANRRLTKTAFVPMTCWADRVVAVHYMGDYNAIATDSTGQLEGVIASWGDMSLGSANVAFVKSEGEDQGHEEPRRTPSHVERDDSGRH